MTPPATLLRHGKTMVNHGQKTNHAARPFSVTRCCGPPKSTVFVCVCEVGGLRDASLIHLSKSSIYITTTHLMLGF
jgi:hypothetical protein